MHNLRIAAAPFLVACAFAIPAQDRKPAPGFVREAGDHELGDLIERAGKFLGRNYLVNDQELAAAGPKRVHLQSRLELDATGCEEVVSRLCYTAGLVMVPVDARRGIWEWVAMQGPKRSELVNHALEMTPEEVLRRSAWRVCVITRIPLRNLNPNAAANTLQPFFVGAGRQGAIWLHLGLVGDDRGLILTGIADCVAGAIRLIQDADNAAPARATEDEWRKAIETRVAALEAAQREKK